MSLIHRPQLWLAYGLLALAVLLSRGVAEEETANEGPEGNPYAARAGASVEELEKFIQRMQDKPESIRKRQEFQDAIADAGQRILAGEASVAQRLLAAQSLLEALGRQSPGRSPAGDRRRGPGAPGRSKADGSPGRQAGVGRRQEPVRGS